MPMAAALQVAHPGVQINNVLLNGRTLTTKTVEVSGVSAALPKSHRLTIFSVAGVIAKDFARLRVSEDREERVRS
jgi:hypothetical protein